MQCANYSWNWRNMFSNVCLGIRIIWTFTNWVSMTDSTDNVYIMCRICEICMRKCLLLYFKDGFTHSIFFEKSFFKLIFFCKKGCGQMCADYKQCFVAFSFYFQCGFFLPFFNGLLFRTWKNAKLEYSFKYINNATLITINDD